MSDGGRSLSSGMSLPQWMKNKMNDRLNFEQNAFSPPENDDNFLYIRYNRSARDSGNGQLNPKLQIVSNDPSKESASSTKTNLSNHTASCKQFLSDSSSETSDSKLTQIKSTGTDDGFKGEAAACGSSVVRVASQMVTGKLTRGFTISEEEFGTQPPGFNPSIRRGSKSLPSSPLVSPNSSPKSRRRSPNKYFTGDVDKIQGSWILSGLLRKHDHISRSVSVITEEPPDTLPTKTLSQMSIDEIQEQKFLKKSVKPKSSELREMNFWSPTSM